jgi:NADPH:quinone reductase
MRAAVYRTTGPARDVLRIEDLDPPAPGPGEVRVRVTVSGVNPTDWKARSGSRGLGDLPFQIPNQDGAGLIESVGEDVDPDRVGQRVWIFFAAWKRPWGTAAELCVVPADHAVPLPDGVSDDLGASMGIPALAAHRCLFADGPLDGAAVLVAGGAGAVGHYAIELATWRGARVISTVSSPEKAALARAAGAAVVVDYNDPTATAAIRAAAPQGVDRIVEVALHRNLKLDRDVAADHATISAYANGGSTRVAASDFLDRNVVVRFVLVYTMPAHALRDAVADVTRALGDRALTPLPAHRFPLDQIADAHDAVEAGAVGKVLVDVTP